MQKQLGEIESNCTLHSNKNTPSAENQIINEITTSRHTYKEKVKIKSHQSFRYTDSPHYNLIKTWYKTCYDTLSDSVVYHVCRPRPMW